MPPRKRAGTDPVEVARQHDSTTPAGTTTTDSPTSQSQASPAHATSTATGLKSKQSNDPMLPSRQNTGNSEASTDVNTDKKVRKSKSWYGSWPRAPKASASTSVAKENIFGGTVKSKKSADLSRFDSKRSDDAASIRSTTGTIKTMPKIPESKSDATLTEEHAQQSQPDKPDDEPLISTNTDTSETPKTTETQPSGSVETSHDKKDTNATPPGKDEAPKGPTSSEGWLGWWSRTPFTETQTISTSNEAAVPTTNPDADVSKEDEQPRPVTPPAQTTPPEPITPTPASPNPTSPKTAQNPLPNSWFGFWYGPAEPSKDVDGTPKPETEPIPETVPDDNTTSDTQPEPQPEDETQEPHKHSPPPKAGSTWAFWSRESPKATDKTAAPELGEIAVIGEGSEAHPESMPERDMSPTKTSKDDKSTEVKSKETTINKRLSWRKPKKVRPQSIGDTPSPSASGTSTPTSSINQTQEVDNPAAVSAQPEPSNKSIADSETSAKLPPNLLLPSFSNTYRMKENPSILKQITQFLLRTENSHANQVVRVKDPPKIHKAIAIGIHGLFPATYLRPMIGQPTGTSLRFATLCAEAIRRWTEAHDCGGCEIEKVALEGDGKIMERVDNLWKLMLNWIDHIRSADLILIACHSQGVPVSIMLLEKLIDLGIITNAKIGVCAMAGVALGPFAEYRSGLFMGSAAELWEFSNPESANTKRFEKALKRVVDFGARITFVGSIDDQLVPMESAVYSPANHPYIYRAVFIDGRVHAPDFIAHLVGFALKLRNLGISDHGLIRELSIPLAGSLYSGAGHSRLYYDDAVYDLAIAHALETTTAGPPPPPCAITSQQGPLTSPNPYVLPWIMRGLLEESFVKTELSHEADELLKQFDDWKPTNKALKDVKYRLEAVRSKL